MLTLAVVQCNFQECSLQGNLRLQKVVLELYELLGTVELSVQHSTAIGDEGGCLYELIFTSGTMYVLIPCSVRAP